jgi:alpha-glucosidase
MTNLHKLLFYGALVVNVSVHCPTQALAQFGNGIETHTAVLHHSKAAAGDTNQIVIKSPDGSVEAEIYQDRSEGLTYRVLWGGKVVGGPAHIGLRVTNASGDSTREIGLHPHFGVALRGSIDEQYSFRGAKDIAINKANTLSIPTREIDGTLYSVEARAYDNGFAWRVLLPSATTPLNVLEETSTWVLPEGEVWFGERDNDWKLKSYAGEFRHAPVDSLPTISSQGPLQTAPLVIELPEARGYELLTEAALANYSGMRFRAVGNRTLHVDFTEGSAGFVVTGTLITPWRVTLLCPDLNCLVNNTLTENLNPPPDPSLFRDTRYIQPGRFVWRYMSRETGTPKQEAEFVDFAAALGYEYTLVDDGWKDWATPWASMKDLVGYARSKGIGVFAWKDSNEIEDSKGDYAEARDFLDRAAQSGLAGVKIDFINGESKAKIDFERRVLQLGAERKLMIDFHGLQKPTGEERTFPNGMSREAVRGIELNRMKEGPITASHNGALPFTRFAVGPADYAPVNLQWPGATTWTHQLATAILLGSPWLVIAEDPEFLLKNPDAAPALDVFKDLPTTWDETLVLQGSAIGGRTGMARRKGATWFIASINGSSVPVGPLPLPPRVPLHSYKATVISSPEKRSFKATTYADAADWSNDQNLQPGDGTVSVLTERTKVVPKAK